MKKGQIVFIHSSLDGFFNREFMEKEVDSNWFGFIESINENQTNPYNVRWNNGSSLISLSEKHFTVVDNSFKQNVKYVILIKVDKETTNIEERQGGRRFGKEFLLSFSNDVFANLIIHDGKTNHINCAEKFDSFADAENYLKSDNFSNLFDVSLSKVVKSIDSIKIESING